MMVGNIATLAVATCVAGLAASGAWAQGFTFGIPAPDNHVRAAAPDRASRKARVQAVRCRSERHQVYDAQGQLIWRTIRVCG
ncbi:MAG: hypothetical protein JWN71_2813 [Xanthobacteraceae bacterium]|jgi:hypothetical protein|nr:hypothetical protein [Xanthobacteraceae bacterium]